MLKILFIFVSFFLITGFSSKESDQGLFINKYNAKTISIARIKQAINDGASVNARDDYGLTPLMYASAYNTNPKIINLLLKAGADFKVEDNDAITPLIYASMSNSNPLVIQALLKAGAKVNAKNSLLYTPLLYASRYNPNPKIIATLLQAGADINITDDNGISPLMYAILYNKNLEVIKLLLKHKYYIKQSLLRQAYRLKFFSFNWLVFLLYCIHM